MSTTFDRIRELVRLGDWSGSDHALLRLEENGIIASDLADGIDAGLVVEDYPGYHAGACVLVLQEDGGGSVHALWGLRKGTDRPAVLITAYRPDPTRWLEDNRTRRR
jgi:hypothetical protein